MISVISYAFRLLNLLFMLPLIMASEACQSSRVVFTTYPQLIRDFDNASCDERKRLMLGLFNFRPWVILDTALEPKPKENTDLVIRFVKVDTNVFDPYTYYEAQNYAIRHLDLEQSPCWHYITGGGSNYPVYYRGVRYPPYNTLSTWDYELFAKCVRDTLKCP